ncbi:hypothetical protein O181_068751 [Austropuccinia psidii MF-1]|uniref:CCHC-type domain-containing protein n=1 Tax=Austropuccinia psidii MF-1 TaxID=1389203 RepID=A0A9Q3EVF4_9BASI|nr:hypothetical protein [Austropuccinia psidii MF-1]
MPKLSTPSSHIRSPVKPKEEITNPLITDFSHQYNNQVLMKEAPQLKELPTFTGEDEYDHMPFIKTIDMLQEDYSIPDYTHYKPRETFKPNTSNSNEQRKCHKCGGIGHLANNCLKKEKINEIVETEDHNDKEEASDSEKDNEESETSESDEINIGNAQIKDIDLIYEVLDVNSSLTQVGTSDTNLTNIQDAELYRTKPAKGMGYTAGKSSISISMVENQKVKVDLDT